jgi:hypothetical protein
MLCHPLTGKITKNKKGGVGGHLEDTNRWAAGGKKGIVHAEASHGKIT